MEKTLSPNYLVSANGLKWTKPKVCLLCQNGPDVNVQSLSVTKTQRGGGTYFRPRLRRRAVYCMRGNFWIRYCTQSDFSKSETYDYLLATMDTGIVNSTIHMEQFSHKFYTYFTKPPANYTEFTCKNFAAPFWKNPSKREKNCSRWENHSM